MSFGGSSVQGSLQHKVFVHTSAAVSSSRLSLTRARITKLRSEHKTLLEGIPGDGNVGGGLGLLGSFWATSYLRPVKNLLHMKPSSVF
jgi:hypothetical protein